MNTFIKYSLFFCFLVLIINTSIAADDSMFNYKLGGYVKTDAYYDTRQSLAFREGHFLLWPLSKPLDDNMVDTNGSPSTTILSIQTRLFTKIDGPEVFGAKTSGYIEGEFFGSTNNDMNSLRLRHAFVNMKWSSTEFLVGQTWHPFLVAENYADVISFNTGVPFQPFSRNPQFRITQKFGGFKIFLSALTERDFQSYGPDGLSNKYIKNALIPEIVLSMQYNIDANNLFGVGGSFKTIKPRTYGTCLEYVNDSWVSKKIEVDDKVNSFVGTAYLKLSKSNFNFKTQATYGQNMSSLMSIGGYGIKYRNDTTGVIEYSPINVFSVWSEIMYKNDIEFAIFGGYLKNLGANDVLLNKIYGVGADIDQIYRISPRIGYNYKRFKMAAEAEYTVADYGIIDYNDKGKVKDTKAAPNLRIILGFYIFF